MVKSQMKTLIKPTPDLVEVAKTKEDGRFVLENVPSGENTLHAFHPSLGEASKEIAVLNDKNTKVRILFSPLDAASTLHVIEASSLEKLYGGDDDLEGNPFKK